MDAFACEGVSTSEITAIDNSGQSHDPVGYSSKILDKMEVASELFIGGSGCISKTIRGMERKSGVIIVSM